MPFTSKDVKYRYRKCDCRCLATLKGAPWWRRLVCLSITAREFHLANILVLTLVQLCLPDEFYCGPSANRVCRKRCKLLASLARLSSQSAVFSSRSSDSDEFLSLAPQFSLPLARVIRVKACTRETFLLEWKQKSRDY